MACLSIVFATTEGHTKKICQHAEQYFSQAGLTVILHDLSENIPELQICDAVLLAGSLHYGKHQKELGQFIEKNRCTLQQVPIMFVSVSLAAASQEDTELSSVQKIASDYMAEMMLKPRVIQIAAGAVYDKRLHFLSRWLLHWIMYRKGVALDASGETVFTDWGALDLAFSQFYESLLENKAGSKAQ